MTRPRLPPRIAERACGIETSDGLQLEAMEHEASSHRAVICHPHPLHGGTMDNKVVTTSARAAAAAGWSTLRFNFRGVGKSQGQYGATLGEQWDVRAALATAGTGKKALIGFSFGAMVACGCLSEGLEVDVAILLGLPLDGWEIAVPAAPPGGVHVIVAEHDQFCSVASAEGWVSDLEGGALSVIEGTDHFFGGRLAQVAAAVEAVLTEQTP